MVELMEWKTSILSRRALKAAGLGLFIAEAEFALFEAAVIFGWFCEDRAEIRLHLAALIWLVSLAAYVSFLRQYLYRPFRTLDAIQEDFANGLVADEIFSAHYAYSHASRNAVHRMQSMLNQREMMELSVRQSSYLALQNQINPHFLYNTLDAIRGDALAAGQACIADTIEALSTFFAYTISNIDQLATLNEELGHVRDYFCIQKYRFGERLTLKIETQGSLIELGSFYLPRVTLQPLVENAIYHGLESRGKCGTVTITIEETTEHLIIHVIDDGVGMDEGTLVRLNERLNNSFMGEQPREYQHGGIALSNVNSRIRLLCGEDYGLRVYSVEGYGTDVRVLFPKMTKDDVDEKRISENPEWNQEGR